MVTKPLPVHNTILKLVCGLDTYLETWKEEDRINESTEQSFLELPT